MFKTIKKRIKKYFLFLSLAAGLFLLAGCGNAKKEDAAATDAAATDTEQPANEAATDTEPAEETATGDESESDTEELQTVRFGSPNNSGRMLFELLSVGLDQGFLEEELNSVGYKGEYIPIDAAGPGVNEAFAAGDIDIAVYGDFPAVSAKTKGLDTTIVGVANAVQHMAVFVRDGSGIETVADLEGKNVAIMVGTNYQFYWENLLKAEGLDVSKINIINSSDYSTLLSTGQTDAIVTGITVAAYYESVLGLGHILATSADHPEWTTEFLVAVYTPYLKEHPEVAVAVNKALIRSKEYIDANPDALYESSATEEIPADVIKEAYSQVTIDGYDPAQITDVTPDKLQAVADLMYGQKLITQELDTSGWLDTSYYEQAKSELGF